MNSLKEKYQPYLRTLDKLGFCTFKVFEDETITQLKELYDTSFSPQRIDGLYATHNSNPAEKGLEISRKIGSIVTGNLQSIFPEFNYFLGHFMVKGANFQNEFALHQDWNIVDESKYKSYQVWIPLQLTYPFNGGLFVVPGSHLFFNNHRSGSYGIPVVPHRKEIEPLVTNVIVPVGNVFVYHNALFHGSHPNSTNENRIAVIANFVEKIAPTYFFHKAREKATTELYNITGETLIAHLPDLEKGIVATDLEFKGEVPLSPIQNEQVTYQDLISKFKDSFGGINAKQLKQLSIAVNPALEREMNENGFVVLDLLDADEVKLFKDKYLSLFGDIDRTPGRFTTLQDTNAKTKKSIHEFIVKNIETSLETHFKDYEIPVSQYYTKKAFTSGDIDLHADSTLLLNHQLESHYAIWIPLVDVDEKNGCLTLVPKSHQNQQAIFGGSFPGRQQAHREWLREFEIPIPLKAGQAVVFDNNLLHSSTANSSSRDRICFTFRMTHINSDYYSFICKQEGSKNLDVFLETHNYYMGENWDGEGRHISGVFIGMIQNGIIDFKKEEILTT